MQVDHFSPAAPNFLTTAPLSFELGHFLLSALLVHFFELLLVVLQTNYISRKLVFLKPFVSHCIFANVLLALQNVKD